MRIETWSLGDNEGIALLEKECFKYPWSLQAITQTSESDNFLGVVAKTDDGALIGYAGAIFALESADVALVAVSPKARRGGIGFDVTSALLDKLFIAGVKTAYLEVRVSNAPARGLYEKLGFKIVGIRKKYYEDLEDALLMARKLPFER